ncbi:energy-coupling factor transporter ATP-binding protein EcfA2 [Allocatelliglobosispora scoriae]|uniref:Energy-coupling factor transporter ATP-binding protein EcfA2 n=1 Tax=Allocatelliglobosispora scoriae TaxID=643052 RepID=A0A841BPA0_9ACTN|nr:GTPase [Allocatelliglobosispora scoriae]MBB5870907.1 energy-coupling factor transporter ATP-binding protein EcfA2 [Allocatelliglobosispora scoriae]
MSKRKARIPRAADAPPVTASSVHAKIDTVRAILDAVHEHVPSDRLAVARSTSSRALARLDLSLSHTTVALAGTTGSGKSSMFNAFTSLDRSPVSALRPTTAEAYACVWGDKDGGELLLDWLGVQPRRRFVRESALDGNDEVGLRGMVLLDLPDVDSIQPSHRAEVDRLLDLVDVVVWVTDPQKYADLVVHDGYLRRLAATRGGFIVALNQTDRLLPTSLPQVAGDLRRLLDDGDLGEVPLVATSATDEVPGPPGAAVARPKATFRTKPGPGPRTGPLAASGVGIAGPSGIRQLRELLEPAVVGRRAVLERLDTDLSYALDELGDMFAGQAPAVSPSVLVEGLIAAQGVKEKITSSVDRYATLSSAGLPEPWPEAIAEAARRRLSELPLALERAGERALAFDRSSGWKRAMGAVLPAVGKKSQEGRDRRLRSEYGRVAEDFVVGPVRSVVSGYSAARAALS